MSGTRDIVEPALPVTHAYETGYGKVADTYSSMTLRAYAAINLKVPDSGEGWLDGMIRQSLRDECAAKAMQGLVAGSISTGTDYNEGRVAQSAYAMADAMLKARQQ